MNDIRNDTHILFTAAVKFLLKEGKKTDKSLSQATLARSIGVEPANLSGFLNRHLNYSENKRVQISTFFKTSYLDMLNLGYKIQNGEFQPEGTTKYSSEQYNRQQKNYSQQNKENPPPISNVIRIYNSILQKTGIELSPEAQEKLFNLVRKKLHEQADEAAEKELLDVISLTVSGTTE